jgi:acyl-CoA thioesterase-1
MLRRRFLLLASALATPRGSAAPPNAPVILAFGDSLTAGYGLDPSQSYPAQLQALLDGRHLRYRVVNQGISGDTSSEGLDRVAQALAVHPRVVILELGANDGLRGLPLTETKKNLQELIRRFQGAGARVILAGMTLPRNYGPGYVASFEAIYRDLARERRVKLIPFLLEGVALRPNLMQGDQLHPNAAGARQVAETVLRALLPLLTGS